MSNVADMPARIGPVPKAEWTDAVRDVFAILEGPQARENGSQSTVIPILANHPDLARPLMSLNMHLLFNSTLPPRIRDLVILRVVWRYRCEYEWRHHVMAAPKAGVTEAECEAVKQGPDAENWAELERTVLAAADQLCETGQLDDPTWAALAREFDTRQMLDFLLTVGVYTAVSWTFNALRAPLEPGLPQGFEVSPA